MGFRPWGDLKGLSWLLGRVGPGETHMKAQMEVVNRLATCCPSPLTQSQGDEGSLKAPNSLKKKKL